MKILVTGGAGYLGTEIVPLLASREDVTEVVVFDNLSRGNYNFFLGTRIAGAEKVRFLNGDLLDSRTLRKELKGVNTVVHLAAKVLTPFANIDSHFFEQNNHWGTAELVYAVESSEVEHFVYASSSSVYGASDEMVTEQTDPQPGTFYGISKLRGEEHVQRLAGKRKTWILRCGNVYGYNKSMRFDAVINKFLFDAHFRGRISIHGNGKQSRAFIHVREAAKVFSQIAFEQVPTGTYNLVNRNIQILDIVDVLKELYPDLEFIFMNQHLTMRNLEVEPQSELRKYLDYAPGMTFAEEMRQFRDRLAF